MRSTNFFCEVSVFPLMGLWYLLEVKLTLKISWFKKVIKFVACAVSAGNTWVVTVKKKKASSNVSKGWYYSKRLKIFHSFGAVSSHSLQLLEPACHYCQGQTVLAIPQWHLNSVQITQTVAAWLTPAASWIFLGWGVNWKRLLWLSLVQGFVAKMK
jgi:hypothetical protein